MNRIADHDRLPTWRGAINRPTHMGFARNPLCGDEVWIDLEVVGGVTRQARFHGQGCVVSQACASMLCEGVEGKSVEIVVGMTTEEAMDFAIRDLSMNRQRCALIGWEALQRALAGNFVVTRSGQWIAAEAGSAVSSSELDGAADHSIEQSSRVAQPP